MDPLELVAAVSDLQANSQITVEDGVVRLAPSQKGILMGTDIPPTEECLIHLYLFNQLAQLQERSWADTISMTEHLEAAHRPSAIRLWLNNATLTQEASRQRCLLRALRVAAACSRPYDLGAIMMALSSLMRQAGFKQSGDRWAQLALLAYRRWDDQA